MTRQLELAQAECTQELAAALLKTAGDVMTRHGDDPKGGAIVAAGFVMAIRNIGKEIDPKILLTVREMLG